MTLPRLDAISKHWETVPPLSVSVAAVARALGMERAPKKTREQRSSGLAAELGAAGFSQGLPEWLKEATTT